jgi:hypothetical protein
MPPRIAGHDLQASTGCAFFAYADLNEAATMPGASVLAGWPAPPWGQIAMGPTPASLHPVKVCVCLLAWCSDFLQVRLRHLIHTHVCPQQMLGVDDDALNNILNEMFCLNGDNVNPKLCVGGALRPMLEWALAALIMYVPVQFSYESLCCCSSKLLARTGV